MQPFLPLLNCPNLYMEFRGSKYEALDFEKSLLLNSMFALSARFSECTKLWTCEPKHRGDFFAAKANKLFDTVTQRLSKPTRRMLQGCILVTYYGLSADPSFRSWVRTGLCARWAYSLDLHKVDRGTQHLESSGGETWPSKEEERRAWWLVVEMDCFLSLIARRPFNIDERDMQVNLPIHDSAWFSKEEQASIPIKDVSPSIIWNTLQGYENASAYSVYLLCTLLLRAARRQLDQKDLSIGEARTLLSALHGFSLSLPQFFREGGDICNTLGNGQYSEENWQICTTVLLQT